ncbi:MAG: hypothetical protein KAV87_63345 [Desulfobacteraceae bacterium]|nr:hypothetical protein [Desulfobacteraceae bacterium]
MSQLASSAFGFKPALDFIVIVDEKYLIVSKNLDFLGDKIVFEGLKVAV